VASQLLIVDDDPWILRMVCEVLSRRGHEVRAARNGVEALAAALENVPDLVVTDIFMPQMDGWTLAAELRSHAELAFVPILFLSADQYPSDPQQRDCVRDFDAFLSKPFRLTELDQRVGSMLMPRAALPAAPPSLSRISSAAQAIAPAVSSGLQGTLEQVGLASVLAMAQLERASGLLIARRDGETARLFFRRGRPIAARFEGDMRKGARVIYELLTWSQGQFAFHRMDVEVADEIGLSTDELLLEGARRIDEGIDPSS
jgi:CheY-like chemotaxis protein